MAQRARHRPSRPSPAPPPAGTPPAGQFPSAEPPAAAGASSPGPPPRAAAPAGAAGTRGALAPALRRRRFRTAPFQQHPRQKQHEPARHANVRHVEHGKVHEGEVDEVHHVALCEAVDGVAHASRHHQRRPQHLHERGARREREQVDAEHRAHHQRHRAQKQGRVAEHAPGHARVVHQLEAEQAKKRPRHHLAHGKGVEVRLGREVGGKPRRRHGGEHARVARAQRARRGRVRAGWRHGRFPCRPGRRGHPRARFRAAPVGPRTRSLRLRARVAPARRLRARAARHVVPSVHGSPPSGFRARKADGVEHVAAAFAHVGMPRVAAQLAVVPATRALLAVGRQHLGGKLRALPFGRKLHTETMNSSASTSAPNSSSRARSFGAACSTTFASWLLESSLRPRASSSALVAVSRAASAGSKRAASASTSSGSAGRKSARRGQPASCTFVRAPFRAHARGVALPHLVGGEREHGGQHPHQHLQHVGEHALHGAAARACRRLGVQAVLRHVHVDARKVVHEVVARPVDRVEAVRRIGGLHLFQQKRRLGHHVAVDGLQVVPTRPRSRRCRSRPNCPTGSGRCCGNGGRRPTPASGCRRRCSRRGSSPRSPPTGAARRRRTSPSPRPGPRRCPGSWTSCGLPRPP